MATELAQTIRKYHFDHYKSDGLWSVKCFVNQQWLVTFQGFNNEQDAKQAGTDFTVSARAVDIALMGAL